MSVSIVVPSSVVLWLPYSYCTLYILTVWSSSSQAAGRAVNVAMVVNWPADLSSAGRCFKPFLQLSVSCILSSDMAALVLFLQQLVVASFFSLFLSSTLTLKYYITQYWFTLHFLVTSYYWLFLLFLNLNKTFVKRYVQCGLPYVISALSQVGIIYGARSAIFIVKFLGDLVPLVIVSQQSFD